MLNKREVVSFDIFAVCFSSHKTLTKTEIFQQISQKPKGNGKEKKQEKKLDYKVAKFKQLKTYEA